MPIVSKEMDGILALGAVGAAGYIIYKLMKPISEAGGGIAAATSGTGAAISQTATSSADLFSSGTNYFQTLLEGFTANIKTLLENVNEGQKGAWDWVKDLFDKDTKKTDELKEIHPDQTKTINVYGLQPESSLGFGQSSTRNIFNEPQTFGYSSAATVKMPTVSSSNGGGKAQLLAARANVASKTVFKSITPNQAGGYSYVL